MAAEHLSATYLRCEYRVDPLGVGTFKPRLSWIVESAERGQKQTGYRILVATTPDVLARDEGDLWDTGKVASDETIAIVYAGKPLRSSMRCHWKVMVWDRDGEPSNWSQPAMWSMGLLEPSDWQATWIGYDKPLAHASQEPTLDGARWIWFAGDKPKAAPAGTRYFRVTLTLPADIQVKRATMLITVDDQFSLSVNGRRVAHSDGRSDAWRRPVTLGVIDILVPGRNVIAVQAHNSSPGAAGLIAKVVVEPIDGERIVFATDGSWQTVDSLHDGWTETAFDDRDWSSAKELGEYGVEPWGRVESGWVLPPPRYLRQTFTVSQAVRRATVYVSALGLYELHMNGARVGNDYFTPGWTDYNTRVYYNTYDVTDSIRVGQNALGAVVADGWYAGYVGYKPQREHYGDRIRLLCQLALEYEDGTHETVVSDGSWKAALGPLQEADFLMGESYDARKELPGWDTPSFEDRAWEAVDRSDDVSAVLEPYPAQTVRQFAELPALAIGEPAPGVYVVNFGQNFAGVVRLKVRGKPGQKITLRHAERVNPDGTVYTANLRSARAIDRYVCRGNGEETWQPRFTFHGFQYVEVSGLSARPQPGDITGIALSSATPVVGSFECSDEMINRLYQNIYWTQRANFIDIPTDCPQRDERLGWTGDAQVYIRTATTHTDVQAFFGKWLVDLDDAQRSDGQFPMVAPLKVAGDDGGPAWADAGVICPWAIYEIYGDQRTLEKYYSSMARFIAFCRNRSTTELLPPKEFHCFGDWVSIKADTPKEVIYMAYFAHSTSLLSQAACALGKEQDAQMYEDLFARIKRAFNKTYVAEDGRIAGDTQCAYALALAFDLLDGDRREQAGDHLVRKIEERDWHLSTGFVGTKDLMLALAKIGRNDVAYRLLHNTTFPSWGFTIKNGATSIWERWNGWTPENGYYNPGMNSFAHYAFGAVGQWMFENIGGIHTEGPGFKNIVIRPQPGGEIRWAKVGYDSIHGRIASDWRIDGQRLALNVTVPANSVATVHVPTDDPDSVTEGGRPAGDAKGVTWIGVEGNTACYHLESGRYSFQTTRVVRSGPAIREP